MRNLLDPIGNMIGVLCLFGGIAIFIWAMHFIPDAAQIQQERHEAIERAMMEAEQV